MLRPRRARRPTTEGRSLALRSRRSARGRIPATARSRAGRWSQESRERRQDDGADRNRRTCEESDLDIVQHAPWTDEADHESRQCPDESSENGHRERESENALPTLEGTAFRRLRVAAADSIALHHHAIGK